MHKSLSIFMALLVSASCLKAQNDRFFSSSEGLSGTSIHSILQDTKGYLWISLFSSLNRFDGYSFTVYEHKENDSTTINSSYVNVVFEDSKGRLWVGTDKGLNLYNYEKDCFSHIKFFGKQGVIALSIKSILEENEHSLWLITSHGLVNYNPVNQYYEFFNHNFQSNGEPFVSDYNQAVLDKDGKIWIGTGNESVLIFDRTRQKFSTINEFIAGDFLFPDRTVMAVHQTQSGLILFGTARSGIVVIDPQRKIFVQTKNSDDKNNSLDRGIYNMITDRKGIIWVGTEGDGVKTYDINENKIKDANHLIDIPGVSKSRIFCYEDKEGDMWFGIQERGIYLKKFSSKKFHSIGNSKSNQQLSHYLVSSILTDRNDNFWVSTEGGGINVRWKGKTDFELFGNGKFGAVITDKTIIKLYEDRRGWIWIGTYYEGLYCYRGKNEPLKRYNIPGYEANLRKNYVFDILEDASGNLWIGSNGGGLYYFDQKNDQLQSFNNLIVNGKKETINEYIYALEYDSDSTLWIATGGGLAGWNGKKDFFRDFNMQKGDLANDLVTCLRSDTDGNMWIGSLSGLYQYLPETLKLRRYSTDDGLCSNSIKAIESDDKGKLWISTTAGISRFDMKAGIFTNYFVADGLPCDKYVIGASSKDMAGNICFGGVDGLVHFHPDSILDNKNNPNLILTNFKIFNQTIKYNPQVDRNILWKDINETDTVIINYSHKSITIEFAAINFTAPEKIKYAVQLEGFDPNWQYKDFRQRYATYTNLAPGTYFLNLKSTNMEGLWPGSERKLCIIVKPPFWLTWWAFILYAIFILSLFYYLRKIAIFRLQLKNELRLEHLEREKLEEINNSKMQFFTNISHEIRTPLTMLMAPIERLIESNPNDYQKKNINYIYRNTKRLERIVNQLLELQKIENTQFKLNAREVDIVKFIREIVGLFDETANDKKIELSFEPKYDELLVWIDPEKMDKVLFNLISNAFKFTQPGGLITVAIGKNQTIGGVETFFVSVSDTGRGIEQVHLDRIFDRFYQIENKETGQITGTGIGLHLSKELVEIQHGTITVTSRAGFGSTFTINMPLGRKHLSPQEIYSEQEILANWKHAEKPEINIESSLKEDFEPEMPGDADGSLVLVIEDDIDILNYLEDELSGSYQIIKANNGIDGWKLAFDRTPNLIVSDIMMPGMDGLQLCKKLKSTIETSHIPVILLTARTMIEQEIEGLETGADEYIHKPFHPRLLKLKVDKIIEAREALKQQFAKNTSFTAKEVTVTSADEKFLQKAIDFVKDNLADTDLNIEKMSGELNISRVHLYRKLKAITNQNPTEFIRTIRLKQAAYLLSLGKLNVSEIAYSVGFNSHQYFTNSFQKYFNMSPTEYTQKIIIGKADSPG